MVEQFSATRVRPAALRDAPRPMIALKNLSKSYHSSGNRICILREVNFDIAGGETLAVVGASGIGKSTLLHILGALDIPDSGSLLFQGQDVLRYDRLRMAKFRNQMVGFVFQFHHLLPEFTAVENAMMPGLIRGMAKQRAREAAEAILVRVGLKDRLSYRVDLLSGGEQQRVALARALVLRPPVLLADEPTGNLDRKNSAQVHALLMDLNRELDMTLVVVTHNMELASMMTRRVTIIDEKLVEKG